MRHGLHPDTRRFGPRRRATCLSRLPPSLPRITATRHHRHRTDPGEMGKMPSRTPRTPAPWSPEADMAGDERPFRFFDNREKYLWFVDESFVVARRE